ANGVYVLRFDPIAAGRRHFVAWRTDKPTNTGLATGMPNQLFHVTDYLGNARPDVKANALGLAMVQLSDGPVYVEPDGDGGEGCTATAACTIYGNVEVHAGSATENWHDLTVRRGSNTDTTNGVLSIH